MVLVATAVMEVMDPVDSRLDCCARRSSHRCSHSHESRNGAPVVGSLVVDAIEVEVTVGYSCCDGTFENAFYHQKRFHGRNRCNHKTIDGNCVLPTAT